MYAGHLGLGLAAKQRRPDVPLAAFLVASVATDFLVFSIFHTVPLVVATAIVAFLAGVTRFDREVGLLFAALVAAHFAVDLVTSGLVLWPNGAEYGWHLYNTPLADFAFEAVAIGAGWWLWRRSLPRPDRRANAMLTLLLVSQALFDIFVASSLNS